MSTPKHSSLPWIDVAGGTHIVDPHAWTIANCIGDNVEANAHLIVVAVNAHAELLAAAKGALLVISNPKIVTPEAVEHWRGCLKAAIANAEKVAP